MIVWTISSGESNAEDTLHRAAQAATTAAADWLDGHAPTTPGWDGPAAHAVTVCVDTTETQLAPAYDRRGAYDPDATRRAAYQLRNEITGTAGPRPRHHAAGDGAGGGARLAGRGAAGRWPWRAMTWPVRCRD